LHWGKRGMNLWISKTQIQETVWFRFNWSAPTRRLWCPFDFPSDRYCGSTSLQVHSRSRCLPVRWRRRQRVRIPSRTRCDGKCVSPQRLFLTLIDYFNIQSLPSRNPQWLCSPSPPRRHARQHKPRDTLPVLAPFPLNTLFPKYLL
jgi:hypothetical protein